MAGCSRQESETPDVIILQTGRLRGNVYPLSLQNIAPLQHYQYLAGYIKKVRAEAAQSGARVLLVDLGDSLTGSFAAHTTDSENMVTFFNQMKYDVLVLSNLDAGVTPATLAKLQAPVLNPFANPAGEPATEGSVFATQLDGIPVRLVANFYGDTAVAAFPERFPERFGSTANHVTPVRDYRKLLPEPGPDKGLTLLTWMKLETPEAPPEAFLQTLRPLGVDAILAHRIYGQKEKDAWTVQGLLSWDPPVSLNILRNNGGFALARMDLKRDGGKWKVLNHELLPMTANTAPADETIVADIERFAEEIQTADRPLAELPAPISPETVLHINLAGLSSVPGTDASVASIQSVLRGWSAGPLRASGVFQSMPWTTPVVQLTLTPEQLDEAARNLNLSVMIRDDAPNDQLNVTTSEFFGRLVARQLGLPPAALRATGQNSEFDAFISYLRTQPKLSGQAPAGWNFRPGRQP